ncbi:Alpha/Beta hydrolase protein [Alternaria rosae]|uniref:Alpha/Beta hydrolase protein n=1 Tax=Alternaria rosae TaxID=1187941 RepID=UPI001E8CFDE7|nr:Alpha/Beta hydrolase protein [Alternaria rosae]KAH6879154.1 Alpha/Beta hydrolase protein [Alternaria rosae]
MSVDENTLQHPTLQRTLRGISSTSTTQFRNLKYASIPARYKDSIPDDRLEVGEDGVFDATQFGPSCPQLRGAQAWDLTLVGDAVLPCSHGQGETEKMNEFDCLNVIVTVPKNISSDAKSGGRGLPVFVWVHGGGLSIGANSWPQYDLRRFVERGVETGKPFIGVSMEYRLNIFGFLASEEIGATGNMGYKDQVLAFRWVKKHIAGFGGDPNNITTAGESAGAISLSTLLCANVGNEGLFERVVIMSGEASLRKWRNKWWHQKMCEDQSAYLKIDSSDVESRRRILLDTDAEELAQRLPLAQHFAATVDGQFFTQEVTIKSIMDGSSVIHKPLWCKEFVIGDTQHDALVLKGRLLDQPNSFGRLLKACETHLSPLEMLGLLQFYHLDGNVSQKVKEERLLVLASELRFYLPALAAYRGWKALSPPKPASRYHFHVPNPIDGPFKGLAAHELDVAYLLQNFDPYFSDNDRKVARAMQDQFIRYIHGEGWVEDGKMLVFDKDGVTEVDDERYDEMYRKRRGALLEQIGMERLWRVAEMWQGVRQEEEEYANSPGDSKL